MASDFFFVLSALLPLGDIDIPGGRQIGLFSAVVEPLYVVADVLLGLLEIQRLVSGRVGKGGPKVLRAEIGVDGADALLAAVAVVEIPLGRSVLFPLDARRQAGELRVYLNLHLAARQDALGGVDVFLLPGQQLVQLLPGQILHPPGDLVLVAVRLVSVFHPGPLFPFSSTC